MKKRKMMVVVIAIALLMACTHHSIQKIKKQKQIPAQQASGPYMPTVFIDVALFPGNLYELLIIYSKQ